MNFVIGIGKSRYRLFSVLGVFVMAVALIGCQNALLTALVLIRGTDVDPKYDILKKGKKRVAVVCRSMASNQYEIQNAPREIARELSKLIDIHCQNKKLQVIESSKIEDWLDDCNNDFDSFLEVGRDRKIDADIVIGIEILGFQIRDPKSHYQIQGRCQAQVKAFDCETGEVLASESITVVDPPNGPIPAGGANIEAVFRPKFIQVVAHQIGIFFYPHDPHKSRRIDADNLDMHQML